MKKFEALKTYKYPTGEVAFFKNKIYSLSKKTPLSLFDELGVSHNLGSWKLNFREIPEDEIINSEDIVTGVSIKSLKIFMFGI